MVTELSCAVRSQPSLQCTTTDLPRSRRSAILTAARSTARQWRSQLVESREDSQSRSLVAGKHRERILARLSRMTWMLWMLWKDSSMFG